MFARVSVYDLPDERMEDAVEHFRAALEEISQLEGFHEGFFMVSHDDGRANATTVWTTRAAMTASRVTASRLRSSASRSVEGDIVSVHEYEIAVRTSGGASAGAGS